MSDPTLTEAEATKILRKLEERVRRIDTRVTIIGNAVGAPFNVNTQPNRLPNGTINLPSKHTTMSDILGAMDGNDNRTYPLMLDGVLIAVIAKR